VTGNAYDNTFNGGPSVAMDGLDVWFPFGSDIFISKLSVNGTTLLASTYLGGSSTDGLLASSPSSGLRYNYADEVRGEIEVDETDNIYIASCTRSTDFPMEGNGFQQTFGGGNFDAIVAKLNDSLSTIQWSSFLGGNADDASYSLEI